MFVAVIVLMKFGNQTPDVYAFGPYLSAELAALDPRVDRKMEELRGRGHREGLTYALRLEKLA